MTNATSCGYNKCYFPSQLSERENEGWLIGLPRCETTELSDLHFYQGFGCDDGSASTPPSFPLWSRTWTFAERLQKRFGVGHMPSRPPEIATLAPEQARSLNFKLKRRVDLLHRPHWPGSVRPRTSRRYHSTILLARAASRASGSLVFVARMHRFGVRKPQSAQLYQGRPKLHRTRAKQDQAESGDQAELCPGRRRHTHA